MTESEININKLRELYKKGEDIAVFVGAGASIPLGIPGWKDVIIKLLNKVGHGKKEAEEIIKLKGYMNSASLAYDKFPQKTDYYKLLDEEFEASNTSGTFLHLRIVKKFKLIFTTNYDSAFIEAFKIIEENPAFQNLPNFNPFKIFRSSNTPCIVYLHGNKHENKYILRREEFENYYPSKSKRENGSQELESFLRYVFSFINIIFIGFSFDDEYLVDFFEKVDRTNKQNQEIHKKLYGATHPFEPINHFAIISENLENLEMIKKLGINLITYGNMSLDSDRKNHKEIERIIDSITLNSNIENIDYSADAPIL